MNFYYKNKNTRTKALELLNLPKNEEYAIQNAIVSYLNIYDIFVFAVPNGTNISNPITRAIMYLVGLFSGVSDLVVLLYKRPVFVEVKTPKEKQSPNQKKFQAMVEKLGFEYYVWRDVEAAEGFVQTLNQKGESSKS